MKLSLTLTTLEVSTKMRLILTGVIIVIGLNVGLAIRDSKMLDRIEERNEVIYRQLEVIPYSPDSD